MRDSILEVFWFDADRNSVGVLIAPSNYCAEMTIEEAWERFGGRDDPQENRHQFRETLLKMAHVSIADNEVSYAASY